MISCYKGNYYSVKTLDLTNDIAMNKMPAGNIGYYVYEFPTLYMAEGKPVSEKINTEESAFASVIIITEGFEGDRHFNMAVYEFGIDGGKLNGIFDVREYNEYDMLSLRSRDYVPELESFDEIALNDFQKAYNDVREIG